MNIKSEEFFIDSNFALFTTGDKSVVNFYIEKAKKSIIRVSAKTDILKFNLEDVTSLDTIESATKLRSFVSKTKIVILYNIDKLNNHIKLELLELLKKFNQQASSKASRDIYFLLSATKLPINSKLVKFAQNLNSYYRFEALEGDSLIKWCQKCFHKEGLQKPSKQICQKIINLAGQSADKVLMLTQQCSLFLDEGEVLTVNHIEQLFGYEQKESQIFEIIDLINTSSRQKVIFNMYRLLSEDISPFAIVGLLYRTFTTYDYIASLLANRLTVSQISKRVGSPEWLTRKHIQAIHQHKVKSFYNHLVAIVECSERLRDRSVDVEAILEQLLSSLIPEVKHTLKYEKSISR